VGARVGARSFLSSVVAAAIAGAGIKAFRCRINASGEYRA